MRGDVWHLRYTMSVQMILKPQKSVDPSTFLSAPYENCDDQYTSKTYFEDSN